MCKNPGAFLIREGVATAPGTAHQIGCRSGLALQRATHSTTAAAPDQDMHLIQGECDIIPGWISVKRNCIETPDVIDIYVKIPRYLRK